jgi:hypothetical protein
MSISRYVVLGVTSADAKTHPAYTRECAVMTPPSVKDGLIVSGYVMTDAFWEECTRDDARGEAARGVLAVARRNVTNATPPRIMSGSMQSESTWTRS